MIKEPKIKLRRRDAYSPRSASWTLYKPEKLAEILEASPEIVDEALEKTGFYKAVKIREGLIKWKMLLLDQCKELEKKRNQLEKELKDIKLQLKVNNSILQNIRNLLRIPREKEGADKIINKLFMKEE